MTQKELDKALQLHSAWLAGDDAGAMANLSGADLRGANLRGANLSGANLRGADLRRANLSGENLSGANLSRANLLGADLHEANLSRAGLLGADLHEANLSGADLLGADLREANLRRANLRGANLSGANLSGANLSRANLRRANLRRADLRCFGDMTYIKTMQIEKWEIGYSSDELQIGCNRHSIALWREWDTETGLEWIANMDSSALESAVRFLPLLLQIITASPAQPTGYEVKNDQEN